MAEVISPTLLSKLELVDEGIREFSMLTVTSGNTVIALLDTLFLVSVSLLIKIKNNKEVHTQ